VVRDRAVRSSDANPHHGRHHPASARDGRSLSSALGSPDARPISSDMGRVWCARCAVPGRVGYLLVAVDIERCLRVDFDEVSRLACAAGAMVQLRGERLQEG
jgi:hypothetical protein